MISERSTGEHGRDDRATGADEQRIETADRDAGEDDRERERDHTDEAPEESGAVGGHATDRRGRDAHRVDGQSAAGGCRTESFVRMRLLAAI